jgi:hypothetical protein
MAGRKEVVTDAGLLAGKLGGGRVEAPRLLGTEEGCVEHCYCES